jgi:hypothetical protein
MDSAPKIRVRVDTDKASGFTERVEDGRDLSPAAGARPVVILPADDGPA